MIKTLKPLLMLLALLTLVSLACNTLAGGSTPAEPPAPVGDGAPTSAPAQPAEGSAPTPETAAPVAGGDSESAPVTRLENINGGLDTFESYRAVIQISYSGTDTNGQAQTGSMEMVQEYIRATGDQHIAIKNVNSTTPDQNGDIEFYMVDNVFYMISAMDGGGCFSFGSDEGMPDDSPMDNVTDVFNNMENLELVARNETVNGIATDHYKFNESAIMTSGIEKASGEVWLAREGGYVVKMTVETTGIIEMFEGNGTANWSYEVTEINKLSEIVVPESCSGQGAAEYPVPENASNQTFLGNFVSFESPDSPAVLAAFYKEKMPEQGWTLLEEQDLGMIQMLSFNKDDGGKVSITISGSEGGNTTVIIVKEP
ncbi:MAG: hypothetical protein OHK0052_03960 [Anaerolineales bacterium]